MKIQILKLTGLNDRHGYFIHIKNPATVKRTLKRFSFEYVKKVICLERLSLVDYKWGVPDCLTITEF